ncbi:MAG: glycosyltransferase family 4 protein [Limisphaerales bacterium]
MRTSSTPEIKVALLTGGQDKPYALGITSALIAQGISLDYIGSDGVDSPELHHSPYINFLNLRGEQRPDAGIYKKVLRILKYYVRLIRYAATAEPRIFHVLWNNKFQLFDRTVLMLYYRLLNRRIVLTAHNVNAAKRDLTDTVINRFSLRIQYHLAHHIFVHTERMKNDLTTDFALPAERVSVIPFGINNTLPRTGINGQQAKQALGVNDGQKIMLFFGRITPYKGLEYLIAALAEISKINPHYRLIIAGPIKNCNGYWNQIQEAIESKGMRNQVIERIGFIPDDKVEQFFKAADVAILPYTDIFQSGVLFLAYSFGVPVIVTDVGSLKEDIIEGKTGFVSRARDSHDLAKTIEAYFSSELFKKPEQRQREIQAYANDRYSWKKVAERTKQVYLQLIQN